MINIYLVNAGGVNGRNRPNDGVFTNAFGKHFSPLREQQFRIAKASNSITGIQNNGCGYNRAKQRSAAYLVDACNQFRSGSPRYFFVLQSASQPLQQAQL